MPPGSFRARNGWFLARFESHPADFVKFAGWAFDNGSKAQGPV